MKFQIKKNNNLFRKIHITIPNHAIQKSIQVKLEELNKTIQIHGFRKGKVPLHILKNRYEINIQQKVLPTLINQYFSDIIQKEKFHIAGTPKFILEQYEKDKNFNCSIEFEIYPKFKLKTKPFSINIPIINITDQDIQKTACNFFKKNTWKEVNCPIKLHHKVSIICINHDLKHNSDIQNLYDFQFIVGNNEILPEMEKEILDHQVNDSFFINITFPQDHCEEYIAGKTCKIEITIKKIEKFIEPSLEDKKNIILNLNQEQYKTIRNMLKKKAKTIIKSYIKLQIIKNLIKLNSIDIPSILVKKILLILKQKNINIYKKNKKNIFKIINQKNLMFQAQYQVKTIILMKKFIKDHSLKPNLNTIQLLLQKLSTSHNHFKKITQLYNNNKHIKKYFNNINLEEQVINKILNESIKHKKTYSFYEAINKLDNVS
ncbi:MAG: trigger factor [Buchnera aphidicola (Floraphis choui)]